MDVEGEEGEELGLEYTPTEEAEVPSEGDDDFLSPVAEHLYWARREAEDAESEANDSIPSTFSNSPESN